MNRICEWDDALYGCDRRATKLVSGETADGRTQVLLVCTDHWEEFEAGERPFSWELIMEGS